MGGPQALRDLTGYYGRCDAIVLTVHADRVQAQGRPYVEVRDHGLGVDAATADKMFEPFYTERSGGTGLGLSVSLSLVKEHGGQLRFESEPGAGTRAMVLLPASNPEKGVAS